MLLPSALRSSFAAAACVIGMHLSYAPGEARAQQSSPDRAQGEQSDGLLGDDFARDTGAIIVTGQRQTRGNLFEEVPLPEESCLANAPEIGSGEPGFTIDASGMRRVRDLERIRKRTRAGTIFVSGGSFVGANFRKAKLSNMCFFGTDLSQTDWTGFSGSGLGFVGVDLTGAKMAGTRLTGVLFRDTKLALVDASKADWQQGQIDGGWSGSLMELNLSGANLTGFRIECGNGAIDGCPTEREGMTLAGANLRRASFHSFFWPDMNLDGARIDQTELGLDHLRSLEGATLIGPIVLRSPRRAIMLFPGEAKQLAEVAKRSNAGADICDSTLEPAEILACNAPGSSVKALLQSVADLTQRTAGDPSADENRAVWIAGRNNCMLLPSEDAQLSCILRAYRDRQALLRAVAGPPAWLKDAGYRLFLSSESAYPTSDGRPGLYSRVLPILLDSAVAAVVVRSNGDGTVTAKGVALEGCTFEASGLRFDTGKATLNFARKVRRRRAPQLEEPLVSFSGSSAEIMEAGLGRTETCAAGDAYPRLEEIELDDALLATIWDRF